MSVYYMGILLNMTLLSFDKNMTTKTFENIMTMALKMINICIYMVWKKGQWETGHFKMFQGRRDTSIGKGTFCRLGTIFSSENRATYPLGIGPLILWELSSGNRCLTV